MYSVQSAFLKKIFWTKSSVLWCFSNIYELFFPALVQRSYAYNADPERSVPNIIPDSQLKTRSSSCLVEQLIHRFVSPLVAECNRCTRNGWTSAPCSRPSSSTSSTFTPIPTSSSSPSAPSGCLKSWWVPAPSFQTRLTLTLLFQSQTAVRPLGNG